MIDDLVQQSARPDVSELSLRILSASVLLPLSVAAVWAGGGYFVATVVAVTAIMCLEWVRICGLKPGLARTAAASLSAAAPVFALTEQIVVASVLLLLGAVTAAAACDSVRRNSRIFAAVGVPYIGSMGFALVWLRSEPSMGLATVLWLMFVVIAMDSAGYTAGRLIGGPKLMPKISPKKTWSGFGAGIVAASAVGLVAAQMVDYGNFLKLAGLSAGLAIFAQAGDLIESGLKRYFSMKDAGGIIPGHGGLLDRMDGFLVATPAVTFLTWMFGISPLTWR